MNTERVRAVQANHGYQILPVKPGMRLEIHETIGEWSNKRIWKFKCLVLKVHKANSADGTFLVRGQTARSTVEKIYPLSFPNFDKVILLDELKVKKSKLYFMRDKVGKSARLKSIIDPSKRNLDLQVLASEGKVIYEEPTLTEETPVEEVAAPTTDVKETPKEEVTTEDTTPEATE